MQSSGIEISYNCETKRRVSINNVSESHIHTSIYIDIHTLRTHRDVAAGLGPSYSKSAAAHASVALLFRERFLIQFVLAPPLLLASNRAVLTRYSERASAES